MKKIIALFIAFSLMALSGNLMAKERRGAEIKIHKTKPQMEGTPWVTPHIRGELIAVKKSSLLLLDSEGADVSVDIKDIMVVKIVRKSKAALGLLLGGTMGALIGRATYTEPKNTGWFTIDLGPGPYTAAGGILGGLIGLVIGATAGSDETIQIEGKSDSEIKEVLEKLRSKARVPDYQ